MSATLTRKPRESLLVSLGFVAVVGATVAAATSPATGYELSLYTATPTGTWIGLGIGFLVSLFVGTAAIRDGRRSLRIDALVLGGLSTVVFAGLPLIRGYRFHGQTDSLTHLGWASAIGDGSLSPFELFYPGIHTVSVLIESVVGTSLPQSMLIVVLLSTVVFVVFVPLAVRTVVPTPTATAVGAFSAFLLLPITTLSTHMHPHAMTQTVLLSALVVYVLLKYVVDGRDGDPAVGVVLALLSVSTVVFHPQYVAHMTVVFLGICVVQFVAHRTTDGAITDHRLLYGQTLFLIAVFLAWTSKHGFFAEFAERAVVSTLLYVLGEGGTAGESIAAQGASLAAVGGGIGEVFLKLFTPQLVFALAAGGLVLATLGRRSGWDRRDVPAVTAYFTLGLIGLAALFVLYFFSDTSEMYFRVFGLAMVLLTVLGALAIDRAVTWRSRREGAGSAAPSLLAVGVGILLVVSLLAVFPSPYVYSQSQHVTDSQLTGYESAFENSDDVEFLGIRDGPNRYDDAIHGNAERSNAHGSISEDAFDDPLSSQYDTDRYLVVTRTDRERETIAYRGLRYTSAEFDSIDGQPGVNRIQSNGEFELYHIVPDEPASS